MKLICNECWPTGGGREGVWGEMGEKLPWENHYIVTDTHIPVQRPSGARAVFVASTSRIYEQKWCRDQDFLDNFLSLLVEQLVLHVIFILFLIIFLPLSPHLLDVT